MPRTLYPAPLLTLPASFLVPVLPWFLKQTVRVSVILSLISLTTATADARNIFVNNQTGLDTLDGSAPEITGNSVGPVRSIRRALLLAKLGDTIILADSGVPYYESIPLVGGDHSGYERLMFTIDGRGATVSGLHGIPPDRWRYVGGTLWKYSPRRKGFAVLVRDQQRVPRVDRPPEFAQLYDLPEKHWTVWDDGTIYYQATPLEYPTEVNFACAQEGVGLSLYRVRNVRIANLNFEHFRIDGINAFDGCENVVLTNVTSRQNGRYGLNAEGVSRCFLRNCRIEDNGDVDQHVGEFAVVAELDPDSQAPP